MKPGSIVNIFCAFENGTECLVSGARVTEVESTWFAFETPLGAGSCSRTSDKVVIVVLPEPMEEA
jgi:hypothetical protein